MKGQKAGQKEGQTAGKTASATGPASGLDAYLDVEERSESAIETGNLLRLVRYIGRHRGPCLAGTAMILLGTGATLLEPRLFGYAIDEAIVPKRWDSLRQLTVLYLGVTCVRVVATIVQSYLFELLGQRVTQDLRCELFSHLERLPVAIFDKNPAGRLLTRVTNDIGSLGEMFSAGFVSMVGNALMVLGILGWMLALNFKLGLIAGAVFPILMWISVMMSEKLRVAYRNSRSRLSALNAFLAENLLGMKVVHQFNREKLHLERFHRLNEWYCEAQVGTIRVFALFQPAITIAAGLSLALVIGFGGKATWEGSIKVGVLVAYFSYALSLFQPLREIADKWNVFLSGMASAERVFSILDWKAELPAEEATLPARGMGEVEGKIVFEDVWFAYKADHWVLKNFRLEIPAGARIGIVGHTGSGKTTLISLLMRFYEPQRGRILIDGRDIREIPKRDLRSAIGIVQQDVFLFSGSFRDNVTFWGEPGPPGSEEEKTLATLGVDLSGTADLYERGANVSMGERQVLAFARAAVARPQIWILDEATSNMDSETESKLQKMLDKVTRGAEGPRTSLLIAHRLATVRTADRIIVLHKGALIEQGNHSELMRAGGLYARLYRFQEAEERNTAAAEGARGPKTTEPQAADPAPTR